MNPRQKFALLMALLTGVFLAGCIDSAPDKKYDKNHPAPVSPAILPKTATLVGSGSGRFDYHVTADGEIYIVNVSKQKDLVYSGPFVAGQVIQMDPAHTRLQFDGHTVDEPGLKVTDHIEVYEDRN